MYSKEELLQMSTLIRDAATNRVAMFSNEKAAKNADEAIRKFHNEILGGELSWNFDGDCIESVDCFQQECHFYYLGKCSKTRAS